MKISLKLAFLLPTLLILSCSEDDNDGNIDSCLTLQTEIEAETVVLTEATLAFAFEPTSQNCAAYKSSLEKAISLSKEGAECIDSANRAEYESDIADLENILADISC